MKDYLGPLIMNCFLSLPRCHLLAFFWIAGLLNCNKSIGWYLDNLHFPRIAFLYNLVELSTPTQCGHVTYTERHPSQISILGHHIDSSSNTTVTYKLLLRQVA